MPSEVIYNETLSGTAYLILFATLLVIIGGLAWCFYRAIKVAGERAEAQLPDDGETPTVES